MEAPEIIWLEDARERSPGLLGGKADRLAALCRAGFRVPRGFCITTAAHRHYLEAAGIDRFDEAGRAQDVIPGGTIPESIVGKIQVAFRRLGASPSLSAPPPSQRTLPMLPSRDSWTRFSM